MRRFLAFMMALAMLLSLAACDRPTEPVATEADNTVTVSTVDEFLAALAPNQTIHLLPGNYCLSDASDYGKSSENPYYKWISGNEGYELNLRKLRNLTVIGSGMDQTFLETEAVGETVLELISCENVTLRDMAVGIGGSTAEYGNNCVLAMGFCNGIKLEATELFGTSIGFYADDCQDLTISDSHIYDCTRSAVDLYACQNVSLNGCAIYGVGNEVAKAGCILSAGLGSNVTMESCSVSDCKSISLISSNVGEGNVLLKNTLFSGNKVFDDAFVAMGSNITIDNCEFTSNQVENWVDHLSGSMVKDAGGNVIQAADFHKINKRNGSTADQLAEEDTPWQEITVSNIDEFLAALGPNRQIRLAPGTYNLCDASNYGQETDSLYYVWEDMRDGYGLVLKYVKGLTILGSGADQTFIETLPRTVAVLKLSNCSDIAIRDMTMGHVEMAWFCEGPVIELRDSSGIGLEGLGLYGCGSEGVRAMYSQNLTVNNCHIYDCSMLGMYLVNCDSVSITNCAIDRIGGNLYFGSGRNILEVSNCGSVIVDNCTVSDCVVDELIHCRSLRGDFAVKNTTFRNNDANCAIFSHEAEKITLDNCTFAGNTVNFWYGEGAANCAVDAAGTPITADDFMAMNAQ